MNISSEPKFCLRLATSQRDRDAAARLRYKVFISELGGRGDHVDHENQLEVDIYDPYFDHLILVDPTRDPESLDDVVGVYRMLRSEKMAQIGQFYSEDEYDLAPLKSSGRKLLELGRSCVHPDYRGGPAMFHLWQGLSDYIAKHEIEVMFGVASFHGTDIDAVAQSLSLLRHTHLAPKELRPRSKKYQEMGLIPVDQIDRPAAIKLTPALIKAYLRLGGMVGDGAFIDYKFNTVDVCLVLDMDNISTRHRDIYAKARQG